MITIHPDNIAEGVILVLDHDGREVPHLLTLDVVYTIFVSRSCLTYSSV